MLFFLPLTHNGVDLIYLPNISDEDVTKCLWNLLFMLLRTSLFQVKALLVCKVSFRISDPYVVKKVVF